MSGSSQDRESPHVYLVILHAGAVLKDLMPYPAPDGVAADFLRTDGAILHPDVGGAAPLFCPQPHKSSAAVRAKDNAFIFTFECSPSLPGLLILIIP